MKIKSNRLWLKPIEETDIDDLRNWRNKYHDKFFDAGEITKEQQTMWYKRYRENPTDQMFIVCLHSGDRIGTIALYNIDIGNRVATLGRIILLDAYRGHGYAEEAVRLMMDYAFNSVRLWKVKVETHLDNLDAISVYAKVGFKTTTRPIVLLESINPDCDWRKPLVIETTLEEEK